jgi:signal peptidase I
MKHQILRSRFLIQALIAGVGLISIPSAGAIAAGYGRRYLSIRMEGDSMLPTLHSGEMLKVDRAAYRHATPRRGQIVIFRLPGSTAGFPLLVKRAVGLPGEEVRVHRGNVYINGHRLSEPYVRNQAEYEYLHQRVPAGAYFLLGDNRNNSEDSHLFGSVPLHKILGKVILH